KGGSPADPLQGAERESLEAAAVAGLGDEHPPLPLLGQKSDIEPGGTGRRDISHLRQFGVTDGGAVFGLDLDRHAWWALLTLSSTGRWVPQVYGIGSSTGQSGQLITAEAPR